MKVWMLSAASGNRVFPSPELAAEYFKREHPNMSRISNTFFTQPNYKGQYALLHPEPIEWPLEASSPWLKYHSKAPILINDLRNS